MPFPVAKSAFLSLLTQDSCNCGCDVTPPTCSAKAIPGPPATLVIETADGGSGLLSIQAVRADNADVPIPPFSVGTNNTVVITATKIDQAQTAHVDLRLTDVAGNAITCDPVLLEVLGERSNPVWETHYRISHNEGFITIYNGNPGLKRMEVIVNGTRFKVSRLSPGEERTLDVFSAMIPGNRNTITFAAPGRPGGSATILISDRRQAAGN